MASIPLEFPWVLGADEKALKADITGATNRLAQYIRGKPNMEALLDAFAAQSQALLTALGELKTNRYISNAGGAQLDAIGEIVGQPRNDMTDAVFRRVLKARIVINKSSGTPTEILKALSLAMGDGYETSAFEIVEFPAQSAEYVVKLGFSGEGIICTPDEVAMLTGFLGETTALGVRCVFQYNEVDASGTETPASAYFTFDGTAAQGFDSGVWATAVEV